jgi:hypothetical protein
MYIQSPNFWGFFFHFLTGDQSQQDFSQIYGYLIDLKVKSKKNQSFTFFATNVRSQSTNLAMNPKKNLKFWRLQNWFRKKKTHIFSHFEYRFSQENKIKTQQK